MINKYSTVQHRFFLSRIVYVIFILGLTASVALAQGAKKNITKTFPITADGKTVLDNKYGSMDINIWDRNEVKIDVTVTVEANNESKVRDILDGIEVDFDNSGNYVSAETEFDFNNSNNVTYKVAYEVYMPATNSLQAKMKYGNLRLGELKGRAEIEVKYGNFYIESVGTESTIEVGYSGSDCTLLKAEDLRCEISYSRLHIHEARNVTIESKYCQGMEIEQCESLTLESKYDRYTIGNLKRLMVETEYSNFTIAQVEDVFMDAAYTSVKVGELKNKLAVDLSYNTCVVEKVMRGFDRIAFDGSHANLKLGIEKGSSYQLNASGKYANVRYDEEGMDIKKDDQRSGSFELIGSKGSTNARSRIDVELSYGSLNIREQ